MMIMINDVDDQRLIVIMINDDDDGVHFLYRRKFAAKNEEPANTGFLQKISSMVRSTFSSSNFYFIFQDTLFSFHFHFIFIFDYRYRYAACDLFVQFLQYYKYQLCHSDQCVF